MILSTNFLQLAENKFQERFNIMMFKKLKEIFPNSIEEFNEDIMLDKIKSSREECSKLGIFTERGIFSYLTVEYLFGDSFYNDPNWIKYFELSEGMGDVAIDDFFHHLTQAS